VKLSRTPASIASAPPKPGKHTAEVLADLGYTPDKIDVLRREGVI